MGALYVSDLRKLRNRPQFAPGQPTQWQEWPRNEELRTWRVLRDLTDTVGSGGSTGGGTTTGGTTVLAIRTVEGDTTLTNADAVVLVDATDGAVTVTLPTAAGNSGLVLQVKKADSTGNSVTVQSVGEEIDAGGDAVISVPMTSLSFCSSGSAWWLI